MRIYLVKKGSNNLNFAFCVENSASCTCCGNIEAKSTLTIVDESILTGNTKAKNLIFNASQKGNVFVENLNKFMSKLRLFGNVAAKSVSIIDGTKISGDMKISVHEIDEAEFSDLTIAEL